MRRVPGHLPRLLAAVVHVLQRPFKLHSLNGHDPLPDGGLQALHPDGGRADGTYSVVNSMWMLDDFSRDNGSTRVVPGSHKRELFDLYDDQGTWSGAIREEDIARARPQEAVFLKGPAGSVTVHNCCSVHGSMPNISDRVRPLLLQTYAAGDSYPLLGVGTNGAAGKMNHVMVRGEKPRWMQIDNRRMPVAPDWFQGKYISIFEVQQRK